MVLDILQNIAALLVTLAVLIAVHEYGHFQVAKWCGVHVERFSIGFGKAFLRREGAPPVLPTNQCRTPISIRQPTNESLKGTEFCVAMIPLGGYVKFLDERDSYVAEEHLPFAFNRKPVWQRALIAAAGPLANFLLAIVVYWLVFAMGVRDLSPLLEVKEGTLAEQSGLRTGDEVTSLDGELIADWTSFNLRLLDRLGESGHLTIAVARTEGNTDQARKQVLHIPIQTWLADEADPNPAQSLGVGLLLPAIPAVLGDISEGGPAARAGLKSEDRIVEVDGAPIGGWAEFVSAIRANPGEQLWVRVERKGERSDHWVTPELVEESGEQTGKIGAALGVYDFPSERIRTREYSLVGALIPAAHKTWDMTRFTVESLVKMIQGLLSPRNLSGPITIAKIAGQTAASGLETYLGFIALISISLAVLNLLPVPMLDGGHLLYYAVEALIGRPIPERLQYLGIQVGLVFLVGIMLLAFYNDLLRL